MYFHPLSTWKKKSLFVCQYPLAVSRISKWFQRIPPHITPSPWVLCIWWNVIPMIRWWNIIPEITLDHMAEMKSSSGIWNFFHLLELSFKSTWVLWKQVKMNTFSMLTVKSDEGKKLKMLPHELTWILIVIMVIKTLVSGTEGKRIHSDGFAIWLQKTLILLDFQTCWTVLSKPCRPQLWAIIRGWPQFCQGSLPVNSENNQFIGLNVHDWPTPPMFWKKDKILTGIVNVWPESWLWLVFHFHEGSLKHLLSLFLYLDMGHNKEMLGVSPISFNLVQQSHFGQITLTSLNQSFEVGAKTLYLADSILWIIKSQKVKSKN